MCVIVSAQVMINLMKRKFLIITAIIFLVSVVIYLGLQFFSPVSQIALGINAKKYGRECEYAGKCGNIVAINCRAEVDGPFYYVDKSSGKILEYCGGYCEVDDPTGKYCQNCPPEEWSCE